MKFLSVFCAIMVAMVFAGPQTRSFCQSKAAPTGDQHRQYDFAAAGHSTPYRLYVPSGYDGAHLYPLIVVLHGGGEDENADFDRTDLRRLAEERSVIVVSPLGCNRFGAYGDIYPLVLSAAAGAETIRNQSPTSKLDCQAEAAPSNTPGNQSHPVPASASDYVEVPVGFITDPHVSALSEQDVMNVVALVRKEYRVDPSRVYLMGNSMGGIGTLYLAAKYPEVWAAIAPAGGLIAVWSYPFERLRDFHVAVRFVHGELDEHANPHWSQVLFEQAQKVGVEADLAVVHGGDHGHAWAMALPQTFDWLLRHQKPPMNGENASQSINAPANVPTLPPPGSESSVRSPEVQADGRVTFRLYAPAAATVLVRAGGVEANPGATQGDVDNALKGVPMAKGEDGVWSVGLGPYQPGVYAYNFLVDGVPATDPRNPDASEDLNQIVSLYEIPGAPFMDYKTDVPHGAIASVWYPSSVTGGLRRMHVYTPPGYTGKEKLPVLYLLHGATESDDAWPTQGRAGAILDNLIAEKKAVPMIVVMPTGHVNRNFQIGKGPSALLNDSFPDDLVKVVIPYIDQHYATFADREHRAIAGLSMGGFQTMTIALEHPELFDYVGIFSSGWFPEWRTDKGVALKELNAYKAYGKPFKLVWVDAGKLDVALDNSDASVELMRTYGITPEVHESEGFHAWNNWRDYLHVFAPLLFRVII